MSEKTTAVLVLDDGTEFRGHALGAHSRVEGETVFSTAMTGYPESLTDPSYRGQILVLTYPLVGNYGVPANTTEDKLLKFFESEIIHVKALIISDYSFNYSHWNAARSLDDWLREHGIPAIYGVDTRAITKIIRERGVMPGRVEYEGHAAKDKLNNYDERGLVAQVSTPEMVTYGNGRRKIVLVDCGCKYNIIRYLVDRDATVIRVPWDYDFTTLDYDGVMLSNGPGDPQDCVPTIANIRKAIELGKPIFGICLGHQLLSIAAGASTFKLKYGHRSHNQPVLMEGTDRAFITSQNHGYAVDASTLGGEWVPYFTNLNDGTNEGIRHTSKPFFSVQFHPEASGGPEDTEYLFDKFISNIDEYGAE